jgi:hypothetical protein
LPYLRQLPSQPWSGRVAFVVNKVALKNVFSEYFGFLCLYLHQLNHIRHHQSAAAAVVGQIVTDVPNGFRLTPPQGTKKKPLRS